MPLCWGRWASQALTDSRGLSRSSHTQLPGTSQVFCSGELCSKNQQRPKEKRILYCWRLCLSGKQAERSWAERSDLLVGLVLNAWSPRTFLIFLKLLVSPVSVLHALSLLFLIRRPFSLLYPTLTLLPFISTTPKEGPPLSGLSPGPSFPSEWPEVGCVDILVGHLTSQHQRIHPHSCGTWAGFFFWHT